MLHIDLDVIAAEDFAATNLSAPGGMRWGELEQALTTFVRQPTLAALVISAYNPTLDADGAAAKKFIELLAKTLALRIAPPVESAAPAAEHAACVAPGGDGASTTTSAEPSSPEEPGKSDTAAS